MSKTNKQLLKIATDWFATNSWRPFRFQQQTWKAHLQGRSGLLNAPTGSGKTYALIVPILLEYLKEQEEIVQKKPNKQGGLRAIWISPIKALTKEIKLSTDRAAEALGLNWTTGIRSGDTSTSEKSKQKKVPPQLLITTPESLQILLASPGYSELFANLRTIVVDEWHELVGSKRGVQMELALSRLRSFLPQLKTWGISATIGNMEKATQVLFGVRTPEPPLIIRANIEKKITINTVFPETIERFPWAGHLGLHMIHRVLPIIQKSKTTLLFTNTRNQCEQWYQALLDAVPDLIGLMAMHHSSIAREQRDWIEEALHTEKLKVVVCTSSLDLGVDFRPVETIIQVGSPKGVARFLQRAGRSGHQPGAESVIHLVPTHSLELIEAAALRRAVKRKNIESRMPYIRSFDVLVQYLVTLACSEGFEAEKTYQEVKSTFSYQSLSDAEWNWILGFITTGGNSLKAYQEYSRVGVHRGIYRIINRYQAQRHRMSIGTIVSDAVMIVRFGNGKKLGQIEERFIGQLNAGDAFVFAGRVLELKRIKDMDVFVKTSKKKNARTPTWLGGRLPWSTQLAEEVRFQMNAIYEGKLNSEELRAIEPLSQLQEQRSHVPNEQELLVEYFRDQEGFHLLIYPFDGRAVHEGMSILFAWRIAQIQPITFSISVNDYGFELLSDSEIPFEEALNRDLFSTKDLFNHIHSSANAGELAKRRFRDIAAIAGLVFKGFPGAKKKDKHIQSSAQLFFQVFQDYEPENLLLQQAQDEVMTFQLEEARLRSALNRMANLKLVMTQPKRATPFAFPLIVNRLREKLSSEKLADRIEKMKLRLIR